MSIANFIPTVWSDKIFTRLRKTLVFQGLCNTDYEGEIKDFGDVVKINEIGPIAVNSYTGAEISWEALDDASKELKIDQKKYFAFAVDDVDRAQAKGNLIDGASKEAAYAMGDTIDQAIAALYADAGVHNDTNLGVADTSVSCSVANVISRFAYMGQYLDEANVPRGDRWAAIPPWVHRVLVMAEVAGVATYTPMAGAELITKTGFIGQALGFNIFMSNNVSTDDTEWRTLFGNRSAISLAFQIVKTKSVERESYFDEGIKGLVVYGKKVVRPNALGCAYLKV